MKQMIKSLLNRAGFDIVRYPDPVTPKIDVLDLVLKHVASLTPDFFFIQIGANDGVSSDPIRKYILNFHWRGILIEPQPDIFRQLVANYEGETQLILENVAIAAEDGIVSLFTVDDPARAPWVHGTTSLQKSHVTRTFGKSVRIKELKVPALSVSSLLTKHAVSRIDLLQIDAEGFDYDIIRMFDFNRVKPTIINFEYCNIPGPKRRECWRYLADWGYRLVTGPMDTLALLEGM
jgi:FkbM family methyltransferase